ncbi:CobW family GTP-binding protein [Pseudovibrio exalbescens]|uniref:CobW family GTP-binding protein n=1 Tax=Pseudovibrio exalbescens TaxID=197461 RepID=UPI0015E0F507|nr:CobW family GTP-binding protein [Pseudovibrio exalbescens]
MIDLTRLLPPGYARDPATAAGQLPRAAMMRINFIPGVRQRLGWRGMRACPQAPMGLTARIEDRTGIYGLYPSTEQQVGKEGVATFSLFYFPEPEDDIINAYSLAAGFAAYDASYLDRLRDFPIHTEFAQLFHIGEIEVRLAPDDQLTLSLIAPQRDRTIAVEGITARLHGTHQTLVEPGGLDQDLPCHDLAYPFFEILAASLAYAFEQAPTALQCEQTDHVKRGFDTTGEVWQKLDPEHTLDALRLGWTFSANGSHPTFAPIDPREWSRDSNAAARYEQAKWWNPMVPGARHSMDKSTMGIEEKPKLILLTGFLGAGKTTYLSHFIEHQAARNQFVAIIQNEIGEKGLDARLLGQHYAVEEIDEGCVCCTLIDNLTAAIDLICQSYQPDFIVVETTGLANPANLLSELSELEDRLEFSSVTCILDALNANIGLETYDIMRDQIAVADTILINKMDLAAAPQVEALKQTIHHLNPFGRVHLTTDGDISPRTLYGVNFEGPQKIAAPAPCGCSHDGHEHHCATHHHYGISSKIWHPSRQIEKEALEAFLLALPPTVLRVKGLVRLGQEDGLWVCQHVPNSVQLTRYRGTDAPAEFLVFIGEDLEEPLAHVDDAVSVRLAAPA